MLSIIRQLGCLQIDPLNVVARSPLLVLLSSSVISSALNIYGMVTKNRALGRLLYKMLLYNAFVAPTVDLDTDFSAMVTTVTI